MKHNWEYKRLGSFLKTTSGGTPLKGVSEYYDGGTIPWLRSGEVCQKEISDCEIYITQKAIDESSAKFVPANSVVIAMYGATAGQVGIIRRTMTTNQAICSIFPSSYYNQDFLYYYLSSAKGKLVEQAYGAAQPNISQAIIKALNIPVPPMEVQERIVAELDKINETIEDCRELLRNLDALAQSLFYDFFGDPNINPKGWEMRKFAEVCDTFTDGDWIESKDQSTDGFRLIQTGNIGEGIYLDKSERSKFISADTFYSLKCKEVFEGDILISRLPDPIGRACILPKLPLRSITAVDCTIVRPKSFILPNFLLQYTLTDAYYNSLSSITKGATRKRVSRGNLGKVLIPVPPISLQEQFAARIEQIEVQKKAVEQTIAELQTLLDSRMDYYFG